MIAPLTEQALDQRVASVVALLDRIGEATANDVGRDDPERVVTVRANAPLDPPYALAVFEYTEIYRKLPQGEWLLTDYYYEFRQQPPPGRRAHHCHDPWAYHQHCVDPAHPERDHHFTGDLTDVYVAHSEFLLWSASSRPMHCAGLTPLF